VIVTILQPPKSTLFPYTTLFRSITINLTRGQTIFKNIVEYPLPKKPGVKDYIFYFVSTSHGYGLGAIEFFKKYYKNHISKNAKRSEEHTSELQSRENLVCRLLLE